MQTSLADVPPALVISAHPGSTCFLTTPNSLWPRGRGTCYLKIVFSPRTFPWPDPSGLIWIATLPEQPFLAILPIGCQSLYLQSLFITTSYFILDDPECASGSLIGSTVRWGWGMEHSTTVTVALPVAETVLVWNLVHIHPVCWQCVPHFHYIYTHPFLRYLENQNTLYNACRDGVGTHPSLPRMLPLEEHLSCDSTPLQPAGCGCFSAGCVYSVLPCL